MDEHEINTFWKKIVNTINDGLMFIGTDGTILMINQAFESLTGYRADEAVGMSCLSLGCDACEHTLQTGRTSAWCKLFEEGHEDMKKCRCLVRRKDGSLVPVLKNASVFRDERDNAIGVVETLTDISEIEKLDRKIQVLSRQCESENGFLGIVGRSSLMQEVYEMIRKAAKSSAPVIITGESGTGKELAANAVHMAGPRKNGPFIQLNCAALNESVLESELFGHAKGAFTGAVTDHIGRFEGAHNGDFFLDEIADIPYPIQTKLLRVLESGRFERVGDITPVKVDVRIITATNRNLEDMLKNNEFRQDLFFRINVIPIHMPTLRERTEDIPLLVNEFIGRLNMETGKSIRRLSHEAMDLFMSYPWPGNVRELKNTMEYVYVTSDGPTVELEDLPGKLTQTALKKDSSGSPEPLGQTGEPPDKAQLIRALRQTGGNQTKAAGILGINRVTVWNRMKKYGIDIRKVMSH